MKFLQPLYHSLKMFAKLFKFLAAASIVASVMASPVPAVETTDLGACFWSSNCGEGLIN